MAFKTGSTTVANNSGQVAWARVTYTANTFANGAAVSNAGGSGQPCIISASLLNGQLTITYYGK